MRQIRTFADDRLAGYCAYCGGSPDTRDHVPAKVFLDLPFPENLPVVASCRPCNESYSLDEEYVACLIEVAACGSADPAAQRRPSIARKLSDNKSLAIRLATAISPDGRIEPEFTRVQRVAEKHARGLWVFETSESTVGMTSHVSVTPIDSLEESSVERFFSARRSALLPEVGSRLMSRTLTDPESPGILWEVVQPERFGYLIEVHGNTGLVRMVIGDYLAAEVILTH